MARRNSFNTCDIDLHIGLAKTGSTAIQTYLEEHRRELLVRHGILFPRSLGQKLSSNLAAACQQSESPDDLRRRRGLLTPESVLRYRSSLAEDLAEELKRDRPERLVISCEHFSSRLHRDDELACLREFLSPVARSVKIWVYLRRQDELHRSAYTTALRSGDASGFTWPADGFERPDLHFGPLLERWARVFSPEALRVRLYERGRMRNKDVVADFCAAAELPSLPIGRSTRPNRALDPSMMEFLRRLNAHIPAFVGNAPNPLRHDLHDAVVRREEDGAQAFKPEGARDFYARFLPGNESVRARFFAGQDGIPEGLFEPPDADSAVRQSAELTPDALIERCAQLWCHAQSALREEQARANLLRAELALERDRPERAEPLLRSVLELFPSMARAWTLRAQLARRQGDRSTALECERRAAELANIDAPQPPQAVP